MKCEIIEDLLPLYLDDACSEESKKAVREHLDSCEKCREKVEKWRYDYVVRMDEDEEVAKRLEEGEMLVKREKKIRKEGRFSVFGWAVLADSVLVLSIVALMLVKMAGLPSIDVLSVPINFLLFSSVGVVGEWIFLIGHFVMKKDMQLAGAFSGFFICTQITVALVVFIMGYMVAMNMEPAVFWESLPRGLYF